MRKWEMELELRKLREEKAEREKEERRSNTFIVGVTPHKSTRKLYGFNGKLEGEVEIVETIVLYSDNGQIGTKTLDGTWTLAELNKAGKLYEEGEKNGWY